MTISLIFPDTGDRSHESGYSAVLPVPVVLVHVCRIAANVLSAAPDLLIVRDQDQDLLGPVKAVDPGKYQERGKQVVVLSIWRRRL